MKKILYIRFFMIVFAVVLLMNNFLHEAFTADQNQKGVISDQVDMSKTNQVDSTTLGKADPSHRAVPIPDGFSGQGSLWLVSPGFGSFGAPSPVSGALLCNLELEYSGSYAGLIRNKRVWVFPSAGCRLDMRKIRSIERVSVPAPHLYLESLTAACESNECDFMWEDRNNRDAYFVGSFQRQERSY